MRLLFFLLLMGLFVSCEQGAKAPDDEKGSQVEEPEYVKDVEVAPSPIAGLEPKLPKWADYYAQKGIPIHDSLFVKGEEWQDEKPYVKEAEWKAGFWQKVGPIMIYSADSSRFLDLYTYELEISSKEGPSGASVIYAESPDHEAALMEGGQRKRLLFCGTPCAFEDGYFANDSVVVIAGLSNTNDRNVYIPALWVVNTGNHHITQYNYKRPIEVTTADYIRKVVLSRLNL